MKKCITISGGFDSGCLPFIYKNILFNYDFVFFNYNQKYIKNELKYALRLADKFKKELIIVPAPLMIHDNDRRNFLFIAKLKELFYEEVIMGNRNIFPFMDHYKDSNFVYLKLLGWLFKIKVILPLVGWHKREVIKYLFKNKYLDFYNCYNDGVDYRNCGCVNCEELRHIFKILKLNKE